MDRSHTQRVLGSQRSNGGHAIAAERGYGFQVSLYAGPTAAVGTGDGQHPWVFKLENIIAHWRSSVRRLKPGSDPFELSGKPLAVFVQHGPPKKKAWALSAPRLKLSGFSSCILTVYSRPRMYLTTRLFEIRQEMCQVCEFVVFEPIQGGRHDGVPSGSGMIAKLFHGI